MMTERLQKILSAAGVASRRGAEEMIRAGRVRVNGRTASLGMSADPERDEITADGARVRVSPRRTYIMLNKPRGYVTTLSDDRGRPAVAELVKGAGCRLYPVGRLDMWSDGLLLLTDDGEAANRLTHPSHGVGKTYVCAVTGDAEAALPRLRQPMELEDCTVSGAEVRVLEREGDRWVLEFRIFEGRNRQIRKMCAACGLKVTRLTRVAEGELRLGELQPGAWRRLTEAEIVYIRSLE